MTTTPTDHSNRILDFPTQLVVTRGGYGYITCEPVAEGVAIVPAFEITKGGTAGFTGRFQIMFDAGKGTPVVACIECARQSAKLFAAIDVDWADEDVMESLTEAQRAQLGPALAPMQRCDCDGRCTESHCCVNEHYATEGAAR